MLRAQAVLFSLTAPARFQKLPLSLPPGPLPARRSPHPATKRFVQAAFRIGFAMRKALSIVSSFVELLLDRGHAVPQV
jgi:hypothetical protein